MTQDRANRLTAAAQLAARKAATQHLGQYADGTIRRFGLLKSGRHDFATLNRAASEYSVRVPYLDTDATPDGSYRLDREDLEDVWLEAWQDASWEASAGDRRRDRRDADRREDQRCLSEFRIA
tara:strand:+ start:159 stop:527 length:369 start_codon:yes stop_codon:yes gene_type:complete